MGKESWSVCAPVFHLQDGFKAVDEIAIIYRCDNNHTKS